MPAVVSSRIRSERGTEGGKRVGYTCIVTSYQIAGQLSIRQVICHVSTALTANDTLLRFGTCFAAFAESIARGECSS